MGHSLNSCKGFSKGSVIGVIERDTRSLDDGSHDLWGYPHNLYAKITCAPLVPTLSTGRSRFMVALGPLNGDIGVI